MAASKAVAVQRTAAKKSAAQKESGPTADADSHPRWVPAPPRPSLAKVAATFLLTSLVAAALAGLVKLTQDKMVDTASVHTKTLYQSFGNVTTIFSRLLAKVYEVALS